MNPETTQLLERHFDIALETPDGVKKLRELILSLAMKGKLVPQDPNDQPASELLKEIEVEKQKLIAEGKLKKGSREAAKIAKEEAPFESPDGWEWCRIGSICHDWGQKEPDKKFTYIDVGTIDNTKGIITSDIQVLESKAAPSRARKIVKKGTVIYSTVRPYLLNIAIIEKEYSPEPIASTAFAIIHPYSGINNRFVYYYLHSKQFVDYVEFHMKGVAYPAINDGNFFQGPLPLPPLAEQKRIVAKIDELMALCDKLEAERNARNEKRLAVHAAAINGLLAAPDKAAFNTSWGFITKHFNEIYSVPENVAELKKAILQLAVMGKLVKQDPNDQPASELLKEIAAEKEKLIAEGKIRKQESLTEIKEEEVPFDVPNGWKWVRLGDIIITAKDGPHHSPAYSSDGIPIISTRNISPAGIDFSSAKYISLKYHQQISKRCKPEKWDILYTKGGTTGVARVNTYDIDFNVWVHVAVLKKPSGIDAFFLQNMLNSPHCYMQSQKLTHGAGNQDLGLTRMITITIPLPPLAEQKRIVAKVDELMSLCNDLEKQLGAAEGKRAEIFDAVLAMI